MTYDFAEKPTRSPFDCLRANGEVLDNIYDFQFMLSLSKHKTFRHNIIRFSIVQ